jgi:hypothetical protein
MASPRIHPAAAPDQTVAPVTYLARCGAEGVIFSFEPDWKMPEVGADLADAAVGILSAVRVADLSDTAKGPEHEFHDDQRSAAMRGAQFLMEMVAAVIRDDVRSRKGGAE